MAFDVGGARGIRPSMNVTPLVDVVLVLLIIFMVVTPMLTRRMWMHVPPEVPEDTPPPPADAPAPIVLTVARTGETRVNGENIARPELAARVQRMLNARADKVVFFDAEEGVRFGAAVDVMDHLRGAGIEDVAVLADPLPGAQ